jgi:hypothetical protein
MKNLNVLSVNSSWVDSAKKADNNEMRIKGQIIQFRNTFRVETIEVLYKLLYMKKGHYIAFKESESKVLNNAFLKIEREQCNGKLLQYSFSVFKADQGGNVMVGRK